MEEDAEKQKKSAADFLHSKSNLQRLRTYQGDVAEVIKSQNESVASIAIKEKVREEKSAPEVVKGGSLRNLPINFITLLLTVLLVAGSAAALLFVWRVTREEAAPQTQVETEIIPHNSTVTLSLTSSAELESELGGVAGETGVSILKLSGVEGERLETANKFFESLKINIPPLLLRNLSGEYALGTHYVQNQKPAYFIALRSNDFGVTFSGLLEWEQSMINDLYFFDTRASSTSTPAATYTWKDTIVKNKDVRALLNVSDNTDVLLAYTFLDKNTVLIINSLVSLSDLSSAYASRSVAR